MKILEQLVLDVDTCKLYYFEYGFRQGRLNNYIDFVELVNIVLGQHSEICSKEDLTAEYIRGFVEGCKDESKAAV